MNLYAYVGNNGVMFVDRTGTVKKWIKENEGNAWYFSKPIFDGDGNPYPHSSLYFIYGGQDYLISYAYTNTRLKSVVLGDVEGYNYGIEHDEIDKVRSSIRLNEINIDYVKIDSDYIDTGKLYEYYENNLKDDIENYNLYVNNCTDEVRSGLEEAGLLGGEINRIIPIIESIHNSDDGYKILYNILKAISPDYPSRLYDEINSVIE